MAHDWHEVDRSRSGACTVVPGERTTTREPDGGVAVAPATTRPRGPADAPVRPPRSRGGPPASLRRLPFAGFVGASVLLALSQTPSLIPRHWALQGVVGGIAAACGYGFGTLASHVWRSLSGPEPPSWVKHAAWWAAAVVAPLAILGMAGLGVRWQRELHELVAMPNPSAWGHLGGVVLSLLLLWLLVIIARGLHRAARTLGTWLAHRLPRAAARALGWLLVSLFVIGLLDGVVIDSLFNAADESFRLGDELVDDGLQAPMSSTRSGGPGSLVDFDDLGEQGRAFVTGGPSSPIDAAAGQDLGSEPIRVYAGLESARTVAGRARLVVEELERTGAFEREVLAVMITTGTGWINPDAAAALEHLWDGDTALAALQYSYLPSWLSFLVDANRGRDAGAELFNAVHARWATLPEHERPRLLVFGESLGADGAEAAFSGIADIRNRTDGVLFVGPPNFSDLWKEFTERRDRDTPEQRPTYDGGATVRFAAEAADLHEPDAPWYEPRVVYLQHPTDPVVWWSPRLILRRPDWLAEARGDGVLPSVRWIPLVSFLQLSADLASTERVPTGFGHDYGPLVADAWAAIAAPDGWTHADTERLRAHLQAAAHR